VAAYIMANKVACTTVTVVCAVRGKGRAMRYVHRGWNTHTLF